MSKEAKLAKWEEIKKQLAEVKAEEMKLRNELLQEYFDYDYDDRTGTTNIPLENGYKLKSVFSLNYKLENKNNETEDMLSRIIHDFGDEGQFIANRLVTWKPEISKSEYKKLNEQQRAVVDTVLITTPATPTLTIVAPKEKK